jgi:hypothetical protein
MNSSGRLLLLLFKINTKDGKKNSNFQVKKVWRGTQRFPVASLRTKVTNFHELGDMAFTAALTKSSDYEWSCLFAVSSEPDFFTDLDLVLIHFKE